MDKKTKDDINWWVVLFFRIIFGILGLVLFVLDKVTHYFDVNISDFYYLVFAGFAIYGDKAADAYAKIRAAGQAINDYEPPDNDDYDDNYEEEEFKRKKRKR